MPAKKKKPPAPGKKNGRPPANAKAVEIGLKLLDAGDPDAAVEKSGVSLATLYRHRATRDALVSVAPAEAMASTLDAAQATTPQAAASLDAEQLREEGRREARELDDRVLAARDPAALRELVDGRVVAKQGEQALASWLVRPFAVADLDDDALVNAKKLLGQLVTLFEAADPRTGRASSLAKSALDALNRVVQIEKSRPRPLPPDEVQERIKARADQAVELTLRYTRDAETKLKRDRAELAAWAALELGPRAAAELVGRVDAMLGAG